MHVISLKRLREFWQIHAEAESDLRNWHQIMEAKTYLTPHQVKEDFPSVSFLGDELTVFNIKSIAYRLVAYVRYMKGRVYVRVVVTHDEYIRLVKAGQLG
jgi:mRNA interferase HigB